MLTLLFEFMYFVYGKPIMRFVGVGVRISSAVRATCDHAAGFCAATSLNRDHNVLATCCCSLTVWPAAARIADSNIG